MILHIKNMVCPRCIMAVTSTLSQLGLTPDSVSLGEAHIAETPDQAQLEQIRQALIAIGFDLVENKSDLLIQRIKQSVMTYVRHDKCTSQPLSEWLTTTIHTYRLPHPEPHLCCRRGAHHRKVPPVAAHGVC